MWDVFISFSWQSQQCLGASLQPSALPSPGNHWIFLCRNIACLTWHECSVLAQCFICFKLILDSTVGVKNWIISIFFKQKAIISHVSPDILYLFRVQAVCRNEMRSDFSQTMLFQGKKTTYKFLHWTFLCLFNIFFAECNVVWSYFRRFWMHVDNANFILWPVTWSESHFQWGGFAYTSHCQVLSGFRRI